MWAGEIEEIKDEVRTILSLGNLMARASVPGRASWTDIPACPGIYCVYMPEDIVLSFSDCAGRAKYAVPTSANDLQTKQERILANGPTDILYIGKAGSMSSNLRKRIGQLARFGVGHARNHRGGEYLWQINEIENVCVLTQCCPRGQPESFESRLLAKFRNVHEDWPLANRTG